LDENIGQPRLFGERDSENIRNRHFRYFNLGVIREPMPEDLKPEYRKCCYAMTIPIRSYTFFGRYCEFAEVTLKDAPVTMEWEHSKLKNIELGPATSRLVELKNSRLNEIYFYGAGNTRDHICLVSIRRKNEIRNLEVIIGTTLIESTIEPDPHGELGNYLAKMNALDLEASEKAKKHVFEEYFKDIVRSIGESRVKDILKYLRRMGFEKADFDIRPLPGTIVNPKMFLEQIGDGKLIYNN
jgi:hypothetical protein